MKVKKVLEMIVKNVFCEAPKIKIYPTITEEKNPIKAHSTIPPNILLFNNIRLFYH